MIRRFLVRTSFLALGATSILPALAPQALARSPIPTYTNVLTATENMVSDAEAQRLAQARGLNIVNVTWEDAGRYKGSSVGPNISDMTIQVQEKDPRTGALRLHLMPVIRSPNFEDVTGDVPLDRFQLLVGNQNGRGLRRVTLKEYLGNIREYLTDSRSWKGSRNSLLAPRDTHALVSAQAAFLPIPRSGEATFNPVLFNYQSVREDPAVLTILATREGTSATIIDNVRDGFEAGGVWGQRLFFNQNGQRASLTGKRLSDFKVEGDPSRTPSASAAGEEGLNMVMLIQVPLKQKRPYRNSPAEGDMMKEAAPAMAGGERGQGSDVENAVIGHGELEGPFTEIDHLDIERDERFPVRVTVQFYKATSNGVVSETDLTQVKSQIDRVLKDAEYVGSLVTQGETGRPTEYDCKGCDKRQPVGWWDDFWSRHEKNVGMSRAQIRWTLANMFMPGWVAVPDPNDPFWKKNDPRDPWLE
jgi:hypothetical protein